MDIKKYIHMKKVIQNTIKNGFIERFKNVTLSFNFKF